METYGKPIPQPPFIVTNNLTRTYVKGGLTQTALDNIDLTVTPGEFVAVLGSSGCGKTTLLNMLTAIDRPTRGSIRIGGRELQDMDEETASSWRAGNAGIVFQFFQLIPTLTALENVMLPMDFMDNVRKSDRRPKAMELLERVGMAGNSGKPPGDLSGGEQQRTAIARALANDPPLLVADEPTGNLDSGMAEGIIGLFGSLSDLGKTVIMVTHNEAFTDMVDRVIRIRDGRILQDTLTAKDGSGVVLRA